MKLLLVETIPEKIDFMRRNKIQLPVSMRWLDEQFEPIKTEVEVPGLGPFVMYRTTKAQALAPVPIAQLTDISINQLVRLKNRILQPYETSAAVYRITIRNDENVATTFSRDDRQQVKNVQGNTFELHVKASKGLTGGGRRKGTRCRISPKFLFYHQCGRRQGQGTCQQSRSARKPTRGRRPCESNAGFTTT